MESLQKNYVCELSDQTWYKQRQYWRNKCELCSSPLGSAFSIFLDTLLLMFRHTDCKNLNQNIVVTKIQCTEKTWVLSFNLYNVYSSQQSSSARHTTSNPKGTIFTNGHKYKNVNHERSDSDGNEYYMCTVQYGRSLSVVWRNILPPSSGQK